MEVRRGGSGKPESLSGMYVENDMIPTSQTCSNVILQVVILPLKRTPHIIYNVQLRIPTYNTSVPTLPPPPLRIPTYQQKGKRKNTVVKKAEQL